MTPPASHAEHLASAPLRGPYKHVPGQFLRATDRDSSAVASLYRTFFGNERAGLPLAAACIRALASSHSAESPCFLVLREWHTACVSTDEQRPHTVYVPNRCLAVVRVLSEESRTSMLSPCQGDRDISQRPGRLPRASLVVRKLGATIRKRNGDGGIGPCTDRDQIACTTSNLRITKSKDYP